MIPYFEQPTLDVGPLTLHAFGSIVAAAVLLGIEVGRRRLQRLQWRTPVDENIVWYIVVGGLLGAHWFSLLFYFPDKVLRDPLSLLRVWEDLSSFGSMVGGLIGLWLFFRRREQRLTTSERFAVADVVAVSFAVALTLGRVACAVAHDHPGTVTDVPVAISLDTAEAREYIVDVYRGAGRAHELPPAPELARLGFHDLGWYEFLYLAVFVSPLMVLAGRQTWPPGRLLVLFIALYMPARFLLDFLRVADERYGALTPAQWSALAFLAAAPWLWRTAARAATTDAARPVRAQKPRR